MRYIKCYVKNVLPDEIHFSQITKNLPGEEGSYIKGIKMRGSFSNPAEQKCIDSFTAKIFFMIALLSVVKAKNEHQILKNIQNKKDATKECLKF